MEEAQNYKNHSRLVPLFHFGVLGIFTVNCLWTAYRLIAGVTGQTAMDLLVAIGLLSFAISVRSMILRVQDRVIRLEMRLRLREVLTADLHGKIGALTTRQLIALRFASDAEMPALVREVLAGTLATSKDIKLRIKDWQGDFLRA